MTECVIFGVVGPLIPLQVSAAQLQQKLQIFWSQEISFRSVSLVVSEVCNMSKISKMTLNIGVFLAGLFSAD